MVGYSPEQVMFSRGSVIVVVSECGVFRPVPEQADGDMDGLAGVAFAEVTRCAGADVFHGGECADHGPVGENIAVAFVGDVSD